MQMTVTKAKIIVVCAFLAFSILIGLFVKIIFFGEPGIGKNSFSSQSIKFPEYPAPGQKIGSPASFSAPVLPIPKPDTGNFSKSELSSSSIVEPFFKKINEAAKAVEKSLEAPQTTAIQNATTTRAVYAATSNPKEVVLNLTDEQFHFLYPDKFIADLTDAQTSFIKEYDPAYEAIAKIETDSQVRYVEEKIVATLLLTDMITQDRANQFVTTIRFTLPQLQLEDLQKYNSYGFYRTSSLSEFINNAVLGKTELQLPAYKRLFLSSLLEELSNALAHNAQAAICGTCNPLPLCFQLGTFTPMTPGTEVVKFACYCTGCLTQLGCLSSYPGQAAIYDQTTGICGTGVGGGNTEEIQKIKESTGLIAD